LIHFQKVHRAAAFLAKGNEHMGVDTRFILTGAKRVIDSRPMYAQVVVTDDCNLACTYCDEYTPGGPTVPLPELKRRIDKLDELGVLVYDFLGGEPLMHPALDQLLSYTKSKRGGSNVMTVITNGFFLTKRLIERLNDTGLDYLQVSVDSVEPTQRSKKSLKTVLPRLKLLACEAKFKVEIQTVLNEDTLAQYDRFRELLKEFPFQFGFSIMHERGGRIAIQGTKFLDLVSRYGVFDGVNFYGDHLRQMLLGDFSRPWKCLGGFKFLYVNAAGSVQWCGQQRDYNFPLDQMTLGELRHNDRHKPCEQGCCLGCVRLVSHSLGEPLKTVRASLGIVAADLRRGSRVERHPVVTRAAS
jgi:MoaA/NifB/PqqE/SkfB family radical SAM enzyme